MLSGKTTVVELARSMGQSQLLRQLEIVLAGSGQREALAQIYEQIGAPQEEPEDLRCVDPFHAAAMRGDAAMIRWLHSSGAQPLMATLRQLPARGEQPNYCESLHLILATMRDDERSHVQAMLIGRRERETAPSGAVGKSCRTRTRT